MCTVSYIPQNSTSYILTSNRDETILRQGALPIMQYSIDGKLIYFPKDPKAGGTWIATDGLHRTACLLNGGFEPHDMNAETTYRKSRGLVVLDSFSFPDVATFAREYDFSGIEPFTLILVERQKRIELNELRWDGTQLHHTQPDAGTPWIWSSVTLYPLDVRVGRKRLFEEWMQRKNHPSMEEIIHFHRWGDLGDKRYDLVMKQGVKQTVSICSIDFGQGVTRALYHDLIKDTQSKHHIYQV